MVKPDSEEFDCAAYIKNIEESGRFPTIGTILQKLASIAGLLEDRKNRESGEIKKFERLAKEEDVDIESFDELLFKVVGRFDELTAGHEVHFLSGSAVLHMFRAYQWTASSCPVIGLCPETINRLVSYLMLVWPIAAYSHWIDRIPDRRNLLQPPIWLPELHIPEPKRAFDQIFQRLADQLSLPSSKSYSIASILGHAAGDDEDRIHDLYQQIEDWRSGEHTPRWDTLEERIIKPLEKMETDQARQAISAFQAGALEAFWWKEWDQTSGDAEWYGRIAGALAKEFLSPSEEAARINGVHIPNALLWGEDQNQDSLRSAIFQCC